MSKLTSIALASVLVLGTAAGIARAQSSNDAPPPPSGPMAAQECGPDAGGEGPDGCGMGPHDMDGDGKGWGHHRGKHGGWGGHGRDGHGRHGGGRMMRIIDANSDGVINDDEAASLADFAFMRIDDNRDGALSVEEFSEPRGPGRRGGWFNWGGQEEAAAVLKVRQDKFAAHDADKNGSVTKAEFFADAKTKLAAADTDKDGKVTPWEFRASFSPMN